MKSSLVLAHWSALVPLAYLLAFRRDARPAYWLLAFGFAISYFAEAVLLIWPQVNWGVTHFYPPVQLGLFAIACGSVVIPILLAGMAAVPTALERPEVVVTALGSVMVVWQARRQVFAPVLYVYAGVGTVFYLLLSTELGTGRFMWFWYPYQMSRLVAFGLFVRYAHESA